MRVSIIKTIINIKFLTIKGISKPVRLTKGMIIWEKATIIYVSLPTIVNNPETNWVYLQISVDIANTINVPVIEPIVSGIIGNTIFAQISNRQ